ncbi:hypothetical protein LCGC14_0352000 [marine sediment metagenome]|uniref:Uncharacterized protein n=1 Tax=marine sediment metagenome TaxID=412755 RepID=A0A0F9VY45_9ZZZZ
MIKVELQGMALKHSTIKLLNSWYKDNSGYDEENWPKIKKVIEENRSSYRRKFND